MLATITDTKGIIALAAAAVAVIALLGCLALLLSVRRLRRAQRLVLGEQGQEDVVAHAARLHEAFEALRAYVDDVALRLDGRLGGVEARCAGRSRTARWFATTPTTSCPGTSRSRSRCSTRNARESC